VKVSGFNNIDRQYDIGLNKSWSFFQNFICDQLIYPDAEKMTINVDNGGFKVKGTKILVMPQHVKAVQQICNKFQKLTKQTAMDDDDVDMVADDETHMNSNIKGNEDQLKEMFDDIHFPEVDEPVPPMDPVAWKVAADKNECKGTTKKQGKSCDWCARFFRRTVHHTGPLTASAPTQSQVFVNPPTLLLQEKYHYEC
jgi:hypothetical protein